MKFSPIARTTGDAAALGVSLLLLLAAAPQQAAAGFRCDDIVADDQKYDLSKLDGAHSVVVSRDEGPSYLNTTYTVDLCRPLKKKGDAPKSQQCPEGSRVCAIQHTVGKGEDNDGDIILKAFPIAGELAEAGGRSLDAEVTRLRAEDLSEPEEGSDLDTSEGGLRLLLQGGFDDSPEHGGRREQQAVITFVCDPAREGTEGEYEDAKDQYDDGDGPLEGRSLLPREGEEEGGDGDGEKQKPAGDIQLGDGKNASLVFEGWGPAEAGAGVDVLRLTWRTKYACAGQADEGGSGGGGSSSSHWGFFTWLVILVFLGTAAYLIFGSWLNYNRYGARGWDLLPHGDTIRDIPYLLKDWTRSVLNTVQGSGSRGGYSAV